MSQPNARLRALVVAIGFFCAAPTCQDLNPDFVEAQSTTSGDDDDDADTLIPDDTGTPMPTTTSGADGSTDDTTTSSSTGPAESSTGPSEGSSTGVEMSTSSGGDESTTGCPGLICGSDGCIDPLTDPDNCGKCDNKCNPGQEQCVDGDCVPN